MGGVKTFAIGPLCKRGHRLKGGAPFSMRYASTRQCVKCHKIWTKKYQQIPRVKAKNRDSSLAYHYRNRESELEQMRKYGKTEAGKAAQRRHRQKNGDKLNANTRAWKAKNREHIARYNRRYANSEKGKWIIVAKRHRRRNSLTVSSIEYTAGQLRARFKRFKNRCLYCRSTQVKLTVDHVFPIAKGGLDCIENVVPCCRSCNAKKYNLSPVIWVLRIRRTDLLPMIRRIQNACKGR